MLNEFYDFIAKKINSFFQAAAADGTLLKGESFCLKLDNEEMVTEVANALEELATSNQSKGEYVVEMGLFIRHIHLSLLMMKSLLQHR